MTVEELINLGVVSSFVNKPESLALSTPELVSVVNRETASMVGLGIQANPWYFASMAGLSYNATSLGWVLPQHEMILKVELDDGTSVTVLPADQRLSTDDDLPKLFYIKGILQGASLGMVETIATSEVVNVFYVAPHRNLSNLADTVDSGYIPDRFQPQIGYQVARYLAAKDARDDDQARFSTETDQYIKRYTTFLGQHMAAMGRIWLPGTRISGASIGAG